MTRLFEILNNPLSRLVFGLIIAATIASPYVNGFTESSGWVWLGCIFFALVVTSVMGGYDFHEENQWLFWLILILYAGLCAYLYFMAGSAVKN